MPTPLVSILLPVYNGALTLDAALDSVAAQTVQDFEIVVVDDGSTDATPDVLSRRHDPRLRVLTTPHVGLLEALNLGLSACLGRYIARLDADDICRPQRLERQLSVMEQDPGVAVCGTQVEAFPTTDVAEGFQIYVDWQNGLLTDEQIRREIFIESPIAHPSAMMRREELVQMGAYQERGWAEDYDLWLRYHAAGRRFAKIAEPLVRWREHGNRATRTDSRYSIENFLRAKSHYLSLGPLASRTGLIMWGAGRTGRRLSKHLIRAGHSPDAFVDIAEKRIGSTMRGIPIIAPEAVAERWQALAKPILLVAVASRGARVLIRQQLTEVGLREGTDFLCVA
jgi:glycosyltransferase involved in cell wall biosynthesis